MNHIKQITPITIRDIDFTVSRQIEQCPKTMMLRELVMNAVEAAAKAPSGRRIVEIKGKAVAECGEARKLAIWNTGPGLSSAQLDHICDLAASLGKDMALEGNFGMGAKVASLPSNTLGMRYRSCRDGVVSQVILGKREGVYGKVWIPVEDSFEEVVDVTEQVREEGEYGLEEDWTEVVLFGNHLNQDTVADPYDGDPEQDRQWITTYLYHRFYRLPAGVEIFLQEGTHPRDGRRQFKSIPERSDAFGRVEAVDVGEGVRIHYLYDPPYRDGGHNKSISGSLTSSVSNAAIVFRAEMYDARKGRKWAADAPAFGIPFGARHISIHVELPDNFPVRHEPYRRFVQLTAGDQRPVTVDDFAELVFRNRPQWLVEIISSLAPKSSASTEDLRKELQDLLNELRLKTKSPREAEGGLHLVDDGGARGAQRERGRGAGGSGGEAQISPTDLIFNPAGAKRANISKNLEQAPEIIPLRDAEDVADKGITGKAARYVRETNQLFVNLNYSAVAAAQENLQLRYATYDDPELVRELARQWSEQLVMGRVGYAVVYAQAKQLIREWTPDDVKKALEPESLSLAADGWRDAVSSAYRSISRRLGAAKSPDDLEEMEVSPA
ncbi:MULTISPECIES: ATP-binding protein [unclassified Rhizobium]|uniref:ATP-binding protein n=1 Tax=unclassified Rhizobium TaxID=2613769 RepID=UPI001ADD2F15|nr:MULTISPECIES: ATP-binding protein [unclassified Rhizobium]MBO9122215.1 ATP-binding protein [Rhizobium sp. 16-488-2b]MBO9172715.1 ATP-binding protein [Rhizobium sp. 16-488-2a]